MSNTDLSYDPSKQGTVSLEVQDREAAVDVTDDNVVPPAKPLSEYLTVGLLCLLVAFGGFVFGWDTGTISGFVNMSDFKRRFGELNSKGEYYLSDVRTGLIVSIFNIGCAIGGLVLGRLADIYGRKKALMIVMVIYIGGITVQISSSLHWQQYFSGRIISGLAVGAVSVMSPMFIAETSPKAIRGILVSCYQLMITAGIFLGYCTTYGTKTYYTNSVQWRVPLGLCFAWALLMISGLTFMPESPRYLTEHGFVEEARASIAKVNKVDPSDEFVSQEFNAIYHSIEQEREVGQASWGELFTGQPKIFYRVFVGVMMQSLQQLTGNNYFFYYGTTIFNSVGLDDPFVTSIILGVVNFLSTFVALIIIDKFGRRTILMCGSFAMAICLLIFASVGVKPLYSHGWDGEASKSAGYVMLIFTCL
ncbi:unnamed protein product [Ambrosiozyma monospora]|uniref:Unnamed protein product n=1 Tax=Ambrosiozyma monospora TaxID=43982 RepID=A0ACB5T7I3_AMBMO|nr:unnamed protein product [Ambrosiozyma monospora]